jgi:hypothetical protein
MSAPLYFSVMRHENLHCKGNDPIGFNIIKHTYDIGVLFSDLVYCGTIVIVVP